MKMSRLTSAVLLGFYLSLLPPALSQQYPHPGVYKADRTGTLKGTVVDPEGEPGPWTVVVEGGGKKLEILTDKRGRFKVELPPSVYTAHVKTTPGQTELRNELTPFLVEAGADATIELNPVSEFVYCSSEGDRVIPVRASYGGGDAEKGLQRLKYDSYPVRRLGREPLKVVIEYCQKTETRHKVEYRSATIGFNTSRMFAERAVFDPETLTLEGEGVEGEHHGKLFEEPYVRASFENNKPIFNLEGGAIPAVKGEGEIKSSTSGTVSFDIKININGVARLTYVDKASGLRLISRKHECLLVTKASDEGVTLSGSAIVTGANPLLKLANGNVFNFTVKLKDGSKNNNKDSFSISIPSLKNYKESGAVTSGGIEVNVPFGDDGRGVAGIPFP